MRGATLDPQIVKTAFNAFQSTRPMRGATSVYRLYAGRLSISIHAPHAGRDPRQRGLAGGALPISIHAPHAGRDLAVYSTHKHTKAFQSTRPMRGATKPGIGKSTLLRFQSTRPMRGAT